MKGKSRYEPSQMRLLERLANQIGNEGTLFHEIASAFKDSNYEIDSLKAKIALSRSPSFWPCTACGVINQVEPK
jgi:hypothetical protein